MACCPDGAKPLSEPRLEYCKIPLGTNFSEILIEIQTFPFKKMRLKMLSAKCCPFRLSLNVLKITHVKLEPYLLGKNVSSYWYL